MKQKITEKLFDDVQTMISAMRFEGWNWDQIKATVIDHTGINGQTIDKINKSLSWAGYLEQKQAYLSKYGRNKGTTQLPLSETPVQPTVKLPPVQDLNVMSRIADALERVASAQENLYALEALKHEEFQAYQKRKDEYFAHKREDYQFRNNY